MEIRYRIDKADEGRKIGDFLKQLRKERGLTKEQ